MEQSAEQDNTYPYRWTCPAPGCGTEHRERWDPTGGALICPSCGSEVHFRTSATPPVERDECWCPQPTFGHTNQTCPSRPLPPGEPA